MKNPMQDQTAFKMLSEAALLCAGQEPRRKKSKMTVNDLLVLAAAGEAVLKTNTALKGDRRRMLRTAVNRAMKHVESL
jgi:hypothetical protein